MHNVIITKNCHYQKHSFNPKFTKCRLAARLCPDLLRSLSAPPESLAVDGRRYENKGRREGRREGGKKKKGKGSCAPMMFFISISSVRSFSPQFE